MYHATKLLGIKDEIQTPFDLLKLTEKGLPRKTIVLLEEILYLKPSEIASMLHISSRTIERYKKERSNKKLNSAITERILRIAMVVARCKEVFEDPELCKEWLKTKNGVFDNKEPISLLRWNFGIDMVLDELGRIEHGIFA
ncbi:MAG: antitoxin Xre/MbcA/ParS toxin-binding domain-containing protein [Syntrophaceae bacterium]